MDKQKAAAEKVGKLINKYYYAEKKKTKSTEIAIKSSRDFIDLQYAAIENTDILIERYLSLCNKQKATKVLRYDISIIIITFMLTYALAMLLPDRDFTQLTFSNIIITLMGLAIIFAVVATLIFNKKFHNSYEMFVTSYELKYLRDELNKRDISLFDNDENDKQ